MFFKFKKPETRGFKYQPRFYNPEEEALQNKIALHQQKTAGEGVDANLIKARLSNQFSSYRLKDRQKAKGWSAANMRLVLILMGFFALFYFVSNKYSRLFMEFLSPVELERKADPKAAEDEQWAEELLPPIKTQ